MPIPGGSKKQIGVLMLILQAVASACLGVMTIWISMPWPGIAALELLALVFLAARFSAFFRPGRRKDWWPFAAWFCSLVAWWTLIRSISIWDDTFSILAWMAAGGPLLLSLDYSPEVTNRPWKILTLAWALLGSVIWLGAAYLENRAGAFYFGLVANAACLIAARAWLRLTGVGIYCVNTLLLLLILLPAADWAFAIASRVDMRPESNIKYFSYEVARAHPAAFQRWWAYYSEQGNAMAASLFEQQTGGVISFRLRPNSHCVFFQCPISINSLGFRGPEIPARKGDTYRIVALGESTTFGYTIRTNDRPWPALLEQMIRDRIHPRRPVEVINAGTPAYPLNANIERLEKEILQLKPDMLISYHGYNGFPLLEEAMPHVAGRPPPPYQHRPLKLLADSEYRVKMLLYRRSSISRVFLKVPEFPPPLETKYAEAYRQLADICRSNGIRLAVANFSMAVNNSSPLEIVEFYRTRFGAVNWQIKANMFHSKIVEAVGAGHPEVCVVNSQPGLDGVHGLFLDLVHLTQDGRQQLAENIFAGIKPVLEKDLAGPESPALSH